MSEMSEFFSYALDAFNTRNHPRLKNWLPLFAVVCGLVVLATLMGFPIFTAGSIFCSLGFALTLLMWFWGPKEPLQSILGMLSGCILSSVSAYTLFILALIKGADFNGHQNLFLAYLLIPFFLAGLVFLTFLVWKKKRKS